MWHSPWYVFIPRVGTLYNVDCLVAIADRVETCNRWHRNIRSNLRAAGTPVFEKTTGEYLGQA